MLVCKALTKAIGDFKIENISFELPEGCVLGLIGRNGTGKTTLLRSMLGYYQLTEGDIYLNNFSRVTDEVELKKRVAYILNENPFPDTYSLKLIGKLYGKYYKGFSQEKYMTLLDNFQLKSKSILMNCSKGQRIRQQIAFASACDAEIYVMDEPAGSLDINFRDELYDVIRDLTSDGKKSVILSTHSLEELEGLADYILWIRRQDNISRTYFFGTADELRDKFRIVEGNREELDKLPKGKVVGGKISDSHSEMLVEDMTEGRYASLKEIMYYVEKGEIV